MGWLKNLFGKSELDQALDRVRDFIDNEETQNALYPAMFWDMVAARQRPTQTSGAFGRAVGNPVPVNGMIGELAYLSKLRTDSGQRLFFHRLGAINTCDVFELVSFDGKLWDLLFLDPYNRQRSRTSPSGYSVSSDVSQFSGFTWRCAEFPTDWRQQKEGRVSGTQLALGYMAMGSVEDVQRGTAYARDGRHTAKLDAVEAQLSSIA